MRDQTAASASTLDLCLRHSSSFGERMLPITTNFETSRGDRRDHRTIPPNRECYELPVTIASHPSGGFQGLRERPRFRVFLALESARLTVPFRVELPRRSQLVQRAVRPDRSSDREQRHLLL